MEFYVETDSLSKEYSGVVALKDCSLRVRRGDVYGMLGPNGAGKTTLLRLLLGFLKPTTGQARIDGLDCYTDRVKVHQQLCYLPGDARLFRTMRGIQVLKFFSKIRDNLSLERAKQIADRLELNLSRWVGFMSTGMRQKLALSVCLAADAPLIILDEPTANLDPNVRREVNEMVREAKNEGRTVIFSSHVLSEVEDVCDEVAILRSGRLVHWQSMHELKRQHRIRADVTGPIGELPVELQSEVSLQQTDGRLLHIETPGELSTILHWLANQPLADVRIEPVGLRAVYERFHSEPVNELV